MAEPDGLRYSKSHEWVKVEGNVATIGITRHAEEELGDVALVLPPEVGRMLTAGDKFGEIESIKAVSDLYAPVSGEVTGVNAALESAPETVNADPYGEGWMLQITMTDPGELDALLDSAAYDALVREL